MRPIYRSAYKGICWVAAVTLATSVQLVAQVPGQDPSSISRSGQSDSISRPQQQEWSVGCTPGEYGESTTECSSVNRRSFYDPYGAAYNLPSSVQLSDEQFNSAGSFYNPPYTPQGDGTRERSRNSGPTRYAKEPPTEFQRYVAASTGVMLPIFGSSLFEQVPATFAPVDRVPVSADYVIAPGDELQLTLWGQVNVSRRLVVDRTGALVLPDVGPVPVAGLNYSQATATLKAVMTRVYKNFDLTLTMVRLHSIQIFLVGEARRPGSYTVSSLSTLVNAIFASGGPSPRGSMRDIELRRGDRTICHFDLYALLLHGDKSKDMQLAPGDVILIRSPSRRIAIVGSVEHPGIYEVNEGANMRELLELSGGLSPLAAIQEAVLERVADGTALEVQRVRLDQIGLRTELRNGDIVRVSPVVPRFENAITLRGNVADPGRFPWHAGMRLSDLIPNRESLLTRDYWKERNHLAADYLPLVAEATYPSTADQRVGTDPISSESSDRPRVDLPALDTRPEATHQEFREQGRNLQADASLGAAMADNNVAPLRNFLPHNLVQPSAPEINWEYAVIERIDKDTLAARIIPFRLGDLVLGHDRSQDLSLQPGDVVTVFSKADFSIPQAEQAKQVRVEGEIKMAGVYTLLPGETLRELIRRAGGFTSAAYLYGAQFTRESSRRQQQKRYDDFVAQLDREVTESAANLSSRVISPQQALTAQSSVASQRDLVEHLKKLPIDGRIVLNLSPTSRGLDTLPDLPLENGDRLYVPSRPSTVNVIGTVFEQATFLYDEDLRVNDYLKKAGGPMRSADRSHMFIVRADGSVVSRSAASSLLFARGFDTLPMFPGDTLVVPTYINRTTFARNLMDWSQIFGNLALGAAAVNVLH